MTDEWGKSLRDWTNSDAGTEWNFAYVIPLRPFLLL